MDELPLSALDAHDAKLASNARTALAQGDAAYAATVLGELIAKAPACAAVRRLWWQSLRTQSSRGGGWMQRLKNRLGTGAIPTAGGDAIERIKAADRVLAKSPGRVEALRQIATAARTLAWIDTECFALEAWAEVRPRDKSAALAQIEALQRHGRFDEAQAAVDSLLVLYPNDGDALAAKRDLGVARTMRQGGWEDGSSFRGKLRH